MAHLHAKGHDKKAVTRDGRLGSAQRERQPLIQACLYAVLSTLVVGTAAYDTRTLLFIGAGSEIPFALGGLAIGTILFAFVALAIKGSPLRLLLFSVAGLVGAIASGVVSKTWVTGPAFAIPFVLDSSVNLVVSGAAFMAFPSLATPKRVAALATSSVVLLFLLAVLYYKMADSGFPLMLLSLAALSLVFLSLEAVALLKGRAAVGTRA